MVNSHSRSFFGQNTGVIIRSSSKKEDFIFVQCIKKKEDGSWEKPSQGEGKVIKMSLEEIVMILKVLRAEKDSWSTFHRYKDTRTQISFNWQKEVVWININHYSKMLDTSQIEIMKLLLAHLLEEKIEFATTYETDTDNVLRVEEEVIEPEEPHEHKNHPQKSKKAVAAVIRKEEPSSQKQTKEVVSVKATVQRTTEKAVLFQFLNGQEAWIPKSTIHNEFAEQQEDPQTFMIEMWVLDNNNIAYSKN